ncbi:hypothetical protein DSO57_1029984 [Entomophthora muscae]|uniref:Uncharacterized protein n=1 Tax=Entomophthora muscae TaxID=34485 RepID=A0ACC2UMB7_9FUNG|nr:hypothetical protein DSO57_1029984 [Entomophthora muscae]
MRSAGLILALALAACGLGKETDESELAMLLKDLDLFKELAAKALVHTTKFLTQLPSQDDQQNPSTTQPNLEMNSSPVTYGNSSDFSTGLQPNITSAINTLNTDYKSDFLAKDLSNHTHDTITNSSTSKLNQTEYVSKNMTQPSLVPLDIEDMILYPKLPDETRPISKVPEEPSQQMSAENYSSTTAPEQLSTNYLRIDLQSELPHYTTKNKYSDTPPMPKLDITYDKYPGKPTQPDSSQHDSLEDHHAPADNISPLPEKTHTPNKRTKPIQPEPTHHIPADTDPQAEQIYHGPVDTYTEIGNLPEQAHYYTPTNQTKPIQAEPSQHASSNIDPQTEPRYHVPADTYTETSTIPEQNQDTTLNKLTKKAPQTEPSQYIPAAKYTELTLQPELIQHTYQDKYARLTFQTEPATQAPRNKHPKKPDPSHTVKYPNTQPEPSRPEKSPRVPAQSDANEPQKQLSRQQKSWSKSHTKHHSASKVSRRSPEPRRRTL